MKKIIVSAMFTLCISFGFAGVPIEHYGYKGDKVSGIMGAQLPEQYFFTNQIKAIACGRNYYGMIANGGAFEKLASDGAIDGQDLEEQALELTLVNLEKHPSTVIVSAVNESSDLVHNFVVNLASDEALDLDVSNLRDFDTLYLISSFNFEAYHRGASNRQTGIVINTPKVSLDKALAGSEYCYDLDGNMTIKNNTNGTTVGCYFTRFQHGYVYWMNAYYPSYPTLFHQGTSAAVTVSDPCKMSRYYTHSPVSGKNLIWKRSSSFLLGFDEVLFDGATGTASCQSNCNGDTTTFTVTVP